MKSYKILSLLTLFSLFFFSCTDENDTEYNKGNQPLEVKASSENIELDAVNPETNALTISWTSGSNQGTNSVISYTYQMDVQGKNFEKGLTLDLGQNIYEKVYKNEELNDLLISWGIVPETEVVVDVRVKATVASDAIEPAMSNIQTIKIKTHKPITKSLYLIGDATPNGWSADNATEMTPIRNTPKGFTWTGRLKAGKFKFITTSGEFAPSYNKGADDTKLYLRENGDDPYDKQFEITEGGNYKITLNLASLAIYIEKTEGAEFTELWFVGNPTGWSFKPMTVDPLDPFVFHYNDNLSAGGEFKIGTVSGSWDAAFLRPETNGAGIEATKVVKWAGDPDNKWNIPGGVYKIALDTREMKINIVPFTPYTMIYLVGDASANGWDIGNATAMSAGDTPYKFKWSGSLNTGELKFTCDKQSDWNGAWFTATQGDMPANGQLQQMVFTAKGAGLDYKWKITEGGSYTIEFDQLKETVIIKKNN
ncbi:SusF/SusE family outer membrane protein [Dysgonomonas alginatilytica]|nr:SusF/SusE family outer membrane protein [Dysgonomonas alginatilytica]